MTRKKLCIALPASVVSDVPHLREKTSRLGLIGRAAAIFRVDEIVIFPDNPHISQKSETNLVCILLRYLETPQYLRKRLFTLNPDLQYAGILPPLRTLHHPLSRRTRELRLGEFREGVILSTSDKKALVDIGVEYLALMQGISAPKGKRVTVKVTKTGKPLEVELADSDEPPYYWGYSVTVEKRPFGSFLKSRAFDFALATSKYGSPIADVERKIVKRWRQANSVLVAFGAPSQGLREIVGREGRQLDELVDFVVNMVPTQGTETIRTEEAVLASLAVLNTFRASDT